MLLAENIKSTDNMTMNICFNCGLLSGKDARLYAFVSSFVKDCGMTTG
jgi:hypothetical protein